MLFFVSWSYEALSEETQERMWSQFAQFDQPIKFDSMYQLAGGKGGVGFVETDDAEALYKWCAPWQPHLRMDVQPVIPVEAAGEIAANIFAWRAGLP